MVIVKDVTGNGYLVVTYTKENVGLISTAIFVKSIAIILRDWDPSEIFPEVAIDHAGHGVRAVHGRSARLQNFDALNCRERDRIDIDKAGTKHSGHTPPIQQDQTG